MPASIAVRKKTHMAQDTMDIYEETLELSAGEVTGNDIGDAPMLPGFLNLIPPSQQIASVITGGVYSPLKCTKAVAARSTHAVIPPSRNAKH